MPEPILRSFRPADIAAQDLSLPDHPTIGITAELDGRIAAYGGLHLIEGRHWVFFHLADESLRRGMFLHRIIVRGLEAAKASGIRSVHAFCDETKPNARKWLQRLGFRPMAQPEKDAAISACEAAQGMHAWIRAFDERP